MTEQDTGEPSDNEPPPSGAVRVEPKPSRSSARPGSRSDWRLLLLGALFVIAVAGVFSYVMTEQPADSNADVVDSALRDVFYDDFDHPSGDGLNGPDGDDWEEVRGGWSTEMGVAFLPAGDPTMSAAVIDAESSDVSIQAVVAGTGQCGVMARVLDESNYVALVRVADFGVWNIETVVDGDKSVLGTLPDVGELNVGVVLAVGDDVVAAAVGPSRGELRRAWHARGRTRRPGCVCEFRHVCMGRHRCSGGALNEPAGGEGAPLLQRVRVEWTTRLWPTGLMYAVLALSATALSERPGWYVADNRFEQYHSPGRGLASMFAIWDGRRGLGGPREDVWIGTTVPPAILRSLGLSAVTTERVFHAACLVLAGLGVVALVRVVRPRIGAVHVIAGLLVMFGPFSASFLVPTNLYVMFAVGPWLVVIFLRGVISSDRWRSAAAFALVVFAVGNADVPGLLYVTLMLAVAAFYLVVIERVVRWRDVAAWSVRAGLLALGCSAWALAKTYYAAEPLDARLVDTELPSASASASSWSESLRGLGNWLTYFRSEEGLVKPQTSPYLDRPLMVILTFVPAIVALFVLWKSAQRVRLLWAAMAVVGLIAMVGGFGAPEQSPIGEGIIWLFDHSTPLTSFRNTYKAAGGLVIGISILSAAGAVSVARWARARNRWWAISTSVLGLVVFTALAMPFITASVYAPDEQMEAVPEYWAAAVEYLDGPAGLPSGRTLVVPAISQADYRWGYVGDDIFDALLARSHAVATGWMLSTRVGHTALEQMTLAAQAPAYRAGVLGPMARRLGINTIVVRNDLDWERLHIARPAHFDGLRNDPDFELLATFGVPGVNVTSSSDSSPYVTDELLLPPVEVYRLIESTAPIEAFDSGAR